MNLLISATRRQLVEALRFGSASRIIFALFVCCLLSINPAARAQISGISYKLSAYGSSASFSNEAGLSSGDIYGGAFGLRFGDRVEVSGNYFFSDAPVETDFSRFGNGTIGELEGNIRPGIPALGGRQVDLRRYGGSLRINAWHGRIVPFVTAGAGILEFKPDGLESTESIYGSAGIGLALSVSRWMNFSVTAEEYAYQVNPGVTFLPGSGMRPGAGGLFSWKNAGMRTLTASLTLIFGGHEGGMMAYSDRKQIYRGSRLRLAVEPFYGQINFNEALGFPESRALAGISAGFDLGPYVGMRGFYWRNTDQDVAFEDGLPDEFGEVEYFGGEVDLRINSRGGGRDIVPFVLMGVGYMKVGEEASFANQSGLSIASRNFAIGGVGLDLGLGAGLRLNGSVRSVLMSTLADETASDPGQIVSSRMYTFGVKFSLGGGSRRVLENQLASERAEAQAHVEAVNAELARMRASLDSLSSARAMQTDIAAVNDTLAIPSRIQFATNDSTMAAVSQTSNISGRTVTIPVPEVGEIYIRFGDLPAGAPNSPPFVVTMPDEEFTTREVSPTAEQVQPDSAAGPLTPEQIEEIASQVARAMPERGGISASELAEILSQIEERMERHVAQELDGLRAHERDITEMVMAPEDTTTRQGILGAFGKPRLAALQPHLGLRMGGATQLLFGIRGDLRFSRLGFRILPEVSVGIIDQLSVAMLGTAAWNLRRVGPLDLYGGPGIGFFVDESFSDFELVLNLLVGAEFFAWGTSRFFTEFSTLDFFDVNRLILGYRVRLQ